MILAPSNDAFVYAACRAQRAIGQPGDPVAAIAVVKELGEAYRVSLVECIYSGNPRMMRVSGTQTADTIQDAITLVGRLQSGYKTNRELILLSEESADGPRRSWILVDAVLTPHYVGDTAEYLVEHSY